MVVRHDGLWKVLSLPTFLTNNQFSVIRPSDNYVISIDC
ncbi:hypothetical protein VRRI112168_00530 [Vreelandella rituensis]